MGDLRETSQRFARIHTGIQMLYSLILEWFEAGSSSLESSQVGIPPSLSAVPNIPKSLVSGGCHHNGVINVSYRMFTGRVKTEKRRPPVFGLLYRSFLFAFS